MNHSCSPNVVWSWKARSPYIKEVRAVRDVEAGEELCTNYIDSFEVLSNVVMNYLKLNLRQHFPQLKIANTFFNVGNLFVSVKYVVYQKRRRFKMIFLGKRKKIFVIGMINHHKLGTLNHHKLGTLNYHKLGTLNHHKLG